jgi:hypothetical protein
MKKVFPRNFIFALVFGLMSASIALADTAVYVTKQQADSAVSVLNITKRLKHFCAPCKNSAVRDEQITSVVASKTDDPNFWKVFVNNVSIDLAYVYFPLTDGNWKNLAKHVGLTYDDIPELLQGQVKQTLTPTPTPSYNPPPNPGANSNALDWMPVVEMDKQIFPSFFLATATQSFVESQVAGVIGDAQGKIGMHIINPNPNTKLKIGIQIDSILNYQELETTLAEKGKYYQIYPKLVWNWDALKRAKKPSPANASFTLYLNGKLIEKKNVVVRIRSINEAVYAYSYLLDEKRWASTSWLFAAYVNEDHEWIDQILKEALDAKAIDSFSGYQEDYKKVILQAFAVWYVLQKRGFKYSSITNTSGSGATEKVFSQYVRLFDDAIKASQANCVDGSVLIASVLKKIGLRVALVTIPGHCFLVFDINGKGEWRGIETTMIGSTDLTLLTDEKSKQEASFKGFLDAVGVGTKRFQDAVPKINEGDPQFNFVDIDRARKNGVLPIAW